MKAFVRIDPAKQEVRLEEVNVPEVQPHEVLIKVEAFGVGIHDRYFIPQNIKFPYVIGTEGAGVITKLGSGVSDYTVGDKVIFTAVLQPNGGTWAEYATTQATSLLALPDGLSFTQGAAIPIAGKTALESMRSLQLHRGDKLFIAGASGAIGTLVIQLAKTEGVHVAASASKNNQEYMAALGAELTVDYNDPDWKNKVVEWSNGGVQAALAIQPGTGQDSIAVVQEGGRLITVSGDNLQVTPARNITIEQMGHSVETQQKMNDLINDIATEKIKLVIEQEYPFNQALDALQKTETRHARGKQVVHGMS